MAAGSRLPIHRQALRFLSSALVGGLLGGGANLILLFLLSRRGPGFVQVCLLVVGWGIAAGLLTLAEQVALRFSSRLRPLVFSAAGILMSVALVAGLAWIRSIAEGSGVDGAIQNLSEAVRWIKRRPGRAVWIGVVLLIPFTGLGMARLRKPRWPVWAQMLVAGLSGVVALGVLTLGADANFRPEGVVLTFALPAAVALALALADRVEAAMAQRWLPEDFLRDHPAPAPSLDDEDPHPAGGISPGSDQAAAQQLAAEAGDADAREPLDP